jgi:hypothetical protein
LPLYPFMLNPFSPLIHKVHFHVPDSTPWIHQFRFFFLLEPVILNGLTVLLLHAQGTFSWNFISHLVSRQMTFTLKICKPSESTDWFPGLLHEIWSYWS